MVQGVTPGENGVLVKYNYNNGNIASDPKLASMNFLNALERIPQLIEQYVARGEKLQSDVPILQQTAAGTWRKEDELRDLKAEVAALERKIALSLKPVDQSDDKEQGKEQSKDEKQGKGQSSESIGKPTDSPTPNADDKVVVARVRM